MISMSDARQSVCPFVSSPVGPKLSSTIIRIEMYDSGEGQLPSSRLLPSRFVSSRPEKEYQTGKKDGKKLSVGILCYMYIVDISMFFLDGSTYSVRWSERWSVRP